MSSSGTGERRQSVGPNAVVHKRTISSEVSLNFSSGPTSPVGGPSDPPNLQQRRSSRTSPVTASHQTVAPKRLSTVVVEPPPRLQQRRSLASSSGVGSLSLSTSGGGAGGDLDAVYDSVTPSPSTFQEESVDSPDHHTKYNVHDEGQGDDEAAARNRLIRLGSNLTASDIFGSKRTKQQQPPRGPPPAASTTNASSSSEPQVDRYSDDEFEAPTPKYPSGVSPESNRSHPTTATTTTATTTNARQRAQEAQLRAPSGAGANEESSNQPTTSGNSDQRQQKAVESPEVCSMSIEEDLVASFDWRQYQGYSSGSPKNGQSPQSGRGGRGGSTATRSGDRSPNCNSIVFDEVDAKIWIYTQLVQVGPMQHAFRQWKRFVSHQRKDETTNASEQDAEAVASCSPPSAPPPPPPVSIPRLDIKKVNEIRNKEEDLSGLPVVIDEPVGKGRAVRPLPTGGGAKKSPAAAAPKPKNGTATTEGSNARVTRTRKDTSGPTKPQGSSSADPSGSPTAAARHSTQPSTTASKAAPKPHPPSAAKSTSKPSQPQEGSPAKARPVPIPLRTKTAPTNAKPTRSSANPTPPPPDPAGPSSASATPEKAKKKYAAVPRCAPPPVLRRLSDPLADSSSFEVDEGKANKKPILEPLPDAALAERRSGFHVDAYNVGHQSRWGHAQRKHYEGGAIGGAGKFRIS